MISFRRFFAALALGLGFSASVLATPDSTDFTDVWWIPSESGWGLNLLQQGNTIFGTLFVYGTDNTPRWYVASNLTPQAAPAGTFKFGGKLYSTMGAHFAASPFTFGGVTEVGDMTLTFTTSGSGTLVYVVNGVTITKSVVRQTFVTNNVAGSYFGGVIAVASACTDSTNNGKFLQLLGPITATFTGTTASFRVDYATNTYCTYQGPYVQSGRLGTVTGTWGCVSGSVVLNNGPFTLTLIDTQVNGLTSSLTSSDAACTYTGRLGGLRDVVSP